MSRVLVPVLLDLTGLRILLVGGGAGIRTKLAGLVEQNPAITVVAPQLSAEVELLVRQFTDARVHLRPFEPADLEDVALVFAMTDHQEVNAQIAELCRERGLWSNVAAHRAGGSFSSPAVAARGGVVAAFSSVAAQPAVAVAARDAWIRGEPCTCL